MQDGGIVQIKSYYGEHSCVREVWNRNMKSSYLANNYLERFKS